MQAYSSYTKTTYDSWEDLVEAETSGYAIVIVYQKTLKNGKTRAYTNVIGGYDSQKQARNAATAMRAKIKRRSVKDPLDIPPDVEYVGVNVAPVWKK